MSGRFHQTGEESLVCQSQGVDLYDHRNTGKHHHGGSEPSVTFGTLNSDNSRSWSLKSHSPEGSGDTGSRCSRDHEGDSSSGSFRGKTGATQGQGRETVWGVWRLPAGSSVSDRCSLVPRLLRPGTRSFGIAPLTSRVPFLQAASVPTKSLCGLAALRPHHSSRE